MTTKEAFTQLTHKRGWYKDCDIPYTTANNLTKRFKENNLSQEKMDEVLTKAGFTVKQEKLWEIKTKISD